MSFILQLTYLLEANKNNTNAKQMEAYMKHLFPFFGIKSPLRKKILKDMVKDHKTDIATNTTEIVLDLYKKKEREFHYCAIELYAMFRKRHYKHSDIKHIEHLVTTNSHWDSVDFIAKHILGQFLLEIPELKDMVISNFSSHSNMWLNRSAILFQLGYKEKTDFELLAKLCETHKESNAFFIKKAIGWALREYSKHSSDDVLEFVNKTDLKPLSKKEALKYIV